MSECVVRMEMPENCCECQLRQEDYEMGEEFCPFTGVECLSIGRQNNCPIICSLQEWHGRLVDADAILNDKGNYFTLGGGSDRYYHETILEYAPTIVPAERSET